MSTPTPAVTNADLRQLVAYDSRNIRRPQFGGVFLAPEDTPAVTSLVAPDGKVAMLDAFESVGRLSEDGITFAIDREVQEVRGWGSNSVLRRDIQSLDATLNFAMEETKRIAYEVAAGLTLRNTPMTATGQWGYTMPSAPPTKYWRAIALGADGAGTGRYYIAKIFHRVSLTESDDETWQASDEAPLMRNVTLGADEDDAVGGPFTELLFGPGALAAATRMGFTVAT